MLTAYVTSFAAIILSFVVHVHATVSATVPISFPCAAYQPSTEHGVTHSHPRFMVVGALSLMFVVSALALRRAVSASAHMGLSMNNNCFNGCTHHYIIFCYCLTVSQFPLHNAHGTQGVWMILAQNLLLFL
ncbi:hypothetical protein C8F04DRAFT_504111 [Mycena alexandri]|uniref:Uncharacterized protein n=1 Tax=Mycena alexandri TaxID=1745969 RepID=A0AAD6RWK6_9AGAR|nr:hypothetical protein C8F04DRAFT_504111 [Mycena alexandri]